MEAKPNNYIDSEIASSIMGWTVVQAGGEDWLDKAVLAGARFPMFVVWPEGGTEVIFDDIPHESRLFHPSSDIAHAFEAVDKLRSKDYAVHLHGDRDGWHVEIFPPPGEEDPIEDDDLNLALALSRAMLTAVRKAKT